MNRSSTYRYAWWDVAVYYCVIDEKAIELEVQGTMIIIICSLRCMHTVIVVSLLNVIKIIIILHYSTVLHSMIKKVAPLELFWLALETTNLGRFIN